MAKSKKPTKRKPARRGKSKSLRGLGGSDEQHAQDLKIALRAVRESEQGVARTVRVGDCQSAFTHAMNANEWIGRLKSAAAYGPPYKLGRTKVYGAFRKSCIVK
jgi:hypothetical protein